jgi:protein TonB
MPFDKSQALDAARQHLLQGNREAAIGVCLKIIDANCDDLETIDLLGDLYANDGRVREAIEEFSKAADGYLADSLMRKAISVLRKIAALDPGNVDNCIKLAGLYAQAGLLGDARQHYLQIAEAYSRKGQTMDALAVYCKIVALDPTNTSMRIKLGELYLREGLNEQAYETFITAGNQLASEGEHRRAFNAYNEALAIRPEGVEALAGVGRVGVKDNGALIDQQCDTGSMNGALREPPPSGDLDIRRTSRALEKNPDGADSTFVVQEISKAEMLVAYGQADRAISMLKKVASSLPENIDVRIKLKDIYLRNEMMAEGSAVCRELELIYQARGDDSRARDYALRASRLTHLIDHPSGDLNSPTVEAAIAPPLPSGPTAGVASNQSTILESRSNGSRAVIPSLTASPLSRTAERPQPAPLQLVRQERQTQQALLKPDPESTNRPAVLGRLPRVASVTTALEPRRAAPSSIVKKRSRFAVASMAAGVLAIIGAGTIIGGLVYNNHLDKQYQALTLASSQELSSSLPVPVTQEPEAVDSTDSLTVDVTPDVTPPTKSETAPREPAVDRRSIITEPAPSPTPVEQSRQVTGQAPPSVSLPRTNLNADSRSIVDARTPAGVPVIAPSGPAALPAPPPQSVTQSGGVVQGAAVKRVEPGYPDLARQTKQLGAVQVEVSIDEHGNVTAARALSGPLVLRNAATGAARSWKFRPSTVGGVPVKTTTVIVFNFKL